MSEDVDAILLFVIGEDPKWQEGFRSFLATHKEGELKQEGIGEHRFRSMNQPFNCVWSIIRCMPWIRKIHLVSSGEKIPNDEKLFEYSTAKNGPELCYVSHQDIFHDASHLPTFNSAAIQANLCNLDGLAENCIYFEDDILVLNKISPSDLFDPLDKRVIFNSPRILGPYEPPFHELWKHAINNSINCLKDRSLSGPYYFLTHFPIPFTKSALRETRDYFSKEFKEISASQVRSESQIVPFSLLVTYMLNFGTAKTSLRLKIDEETIANDNFIDRLENILDRSDIDFLNIIDDSTTPDLGVAHREALQEFYLKIREQRSIWLRKRVFTVKSSVISLLRRIKKTVFRYS